MIMQDPMTSLNPLKTIGDQIMEAVELHQHLKGKAAREKTLEYLRDVGIADPEVRFAQYPHEFSGGMRQRVVIAIAVACNPQILILSLIHILQSACTVKGQSGPASQGRNSRTIIPVPRIPSFIVLSIL